MTELDIWIKVSKHLGFNYRKDVKLHGDITNISIHTKRDENIGDLKISIYYNKFDETVTNFKLEKVYYENDTKTIMKTMDFKNKYKDLFREVKLSSIV